MFTFQNEPISAVSIQRFLENGFKNEKEKQCFTISALEDLLDYYAKSKMNLEEKTNEMLKKQFPHEFEVMQSGATQEKYIKSAEKLFFADGFTKATEVERFFMCPFLHFVEYGLKLKENETSKVRPVDIGNILHSIVEEFAKFQRGKNLDKKQISDFATFTFEKIISQKQFEHLLLGVSNKALAKGLCREAERICQAINFQNQNSKYKISFVEQSFGTNFAKMPEIAVYKSDRKLLLRGKIDRVDTFDTKFRIIDYKTGKGKSEFNMLDLYMGKKLQLYIYLYALKNSWENKKQP